MSTIEIGMFIAVACLGVMTIMMAAIGIKLASLHDELNMVTLRLANLAEFARESHRHIKTIDYHIDVIMGEICQDEEVCCERVSGDTESEDETVEEWIVEVEDLDEDDEDEIDIHLITAEQYHFANGYSKNELEYHPKVDQVRYYFTDETYLTMEDIPEYIGDGLVFFGMNVKEPNVVYVRNHVLNADFRIEKVVDMYND